MLPRTLVLLSLCLISQWVNADSDHPLLGGYPGAEIDESLNTEYEQFAMPVGPIEEGGELETERLVGDLSMLTYEIEGVSTLKVFENYRHALDELGAEVISICELEQCSADDRGRAELGAALAVRRSVNNHRRKPYFIRAQLDGAKGTVHVALFFGGYRGEVAVQQVIFEEVPLDDTLVSVSADYLTRGGEISPKRESRTDEQREQDHPLIARYPGAELSDSRAMEYERIDIPFGTVDADGEMGERLSLTGDLAQHTYALENVSTLKVIENYKAAVRKLDLTLDYECELEACGDSNAAKQLGGNVSVDGSVFNFYRKPYYFVARKKSAQGPLTVAVFVGGYNGDTTVQQVIVEEKGTETDLVKVDADQLYQDIQQTGKALVYGIYFDTDSATVKPESADALKAISDLLESHPELNLYVVGHTDDTGESDYNLSLSSRRAASVVDVLKDDYDVEMERLKAAGVGPYAPVAGNESDDGRRQNRRVELVRRL
ncbi:OmpA family protein [Marinobacter zhanjiangensis]|uniref:OmpA-like domain-containing protein n=1 Tax=Marinobacter zhanjiangensis TaxID=578215 RepID=A0ABQ3AYN1_9GAMM|nr:OmpA family protein [Marinobacter zhanjiangensis]GGY71924.1 hypothetical protein GCM10007071_18660 [Marinobacter zhanjiangensis]